MVKSDKRMYVIFVLSLINWLPVLSIVLIHIPTFEVWAIMFLAYFITPVASVVYIIAALVLIIRKKSKVLIGSVVLTANLIYLLWGMQHLETLFYVT